MVKFLKKVLLKAIWKRLDLSWTLPTRIPLEVNCKSDWFIYNEVFVDLDYDRPICAALSAAGEKAIFFDLGANVGYFGLRWLHLAATYSPSLTTRGYFIEGSREAYLTLLRRLTTCTGKQHEFTFLNNLAGRKKGSALLNISRSHFGNTIFGSASSYGAVEVGFADLDEISVSHNTIDLIKCDIEGSEQIFLETYPELLRKTRRLVIELHTHLVDVEHCERLIQAAGFNHRECLKERPEFLVVHYWKD